MNKLPILAVSALLMSGCGGEKPAPQQQAPAPAPAASPATTPAASAAASPALMDPAKAVDTAPAVFKARFTTTKGDFVVEGHRDWSPLGADRFYNLVKAGYYDGVAFFRDIPGFMVQFGIHGTPDVDGRWMGARIPDDPATGHSNERGAITYAMAGPNTRTTQVFINFGNNGNLDSMGFTPFGKVVSGMDVVDSLYGGYGEGAPRGMGPEQGRMHTEGNAYLQKDFPKLDYVKTARIE